jgi:hypothetical protein
MATVEVRFKVRDSGEFKKKIAEDKKEAEGLIDKIKQAGTAAGSTLLLSLKEARTVMNTLGGVRYGQGWRADARREVDRFSAQ